MSRLAIPARDDVPEASKPILDAVHKQLGLVPNMFRLIAQSPAALQGFTANNGALTKTARRQDARADRAGRRAGERLRLLPLGAQLSGPEPRQAQPRGGRFQS